MCIGAKRGCGGLLHSLTTHNSYSDESAFFYTKFPTGQEQPSSATCARMSLEEGTLGFMEH